MRKNRLGLIGIPAGVIGIVIMLIVPIPTVLLDLLISVNIAAAVIILLVTMHVRGPLEFSSFPAVLLVATMFRLALNVSATRLVLLHGYAGTVIQSFGHFVVGGSLVVGLVVFLILVVIQFVVVTNGAGRVAEVAARFTLDAMPGKQLAIDADLSSGLIDEAEARRRRREVSQEADFYGAMDGASKFVRGDAMAAVVITLINLIGGLAVGVLERHEPISQAVSTYSLLSVGDGLVSQIPALLLSVSTGLIVTRAATDDDFGSGLVTQVARQSSALRIAGYVMCLLALVPGLPHLAFILVGGAVLLLSMRLTKAAVRPETAQAPAAPKTEPDSPEALVAETRVEALELELAVDLVDLVDEGRGGDLLQRVRALRRKIAQEWGLIVPSVRTRDDIDLAPGSYAIRVHGVEVARGAAPPGRVLAIGQAIASLPGEPTTEPVFGLAAKWVPIELRQQALVAGATVVDRSSVVTTHLGQVIEDHAAELLSVQQVKTLLDAARAGDPAVVEDISSAQLSLAEVHRVLRGLLAERVPIRDLVRILEAVCARARQGKDPEGLLEAARVPVGPATAATYARNGVLAVLTIESQTERALLDSLRRGDDGTYLATEPATLEALARHVAQACNEVEQQGAAPVLLCNSKLRSALSRLLRPVVPRVGILSIDEVGKNLRLERKGVIGVTETAAA